MFRFRFHENDLYFTINTKILAFTSTFYEIYLIKKLSWQWNVIWFHVRNISENSRLLMLLEPFHAVKIVKIRIFSRSYFPAFRLNMEIYGVNLCIQSKYKTIRTKKIRYLDTFNAVSPIIDIRTQVIESHPYIQTFISISRGILTDWRKNIYTWCG